MFCFDSFHFAWLDFVWDGWFWFRIAGFGFDWFGCLFIVVVLVFALIFIWFGCGVVFVLDVRDLLGVVFV